LSDEDEIPEFLRQTDATLLSVADDSKIAMGRSMASRLVTLDQLIDKLEEKLKDFTAQRLELSRKEIPEFFSRVLGTDLIGVPEQNCDVVVRPFYHANISKDWADVEKEKAFEYLEELGRGEIISATVSVKFDKGDLEKAKSLYEKLRKSSLANNNPPSIDMGVHWGTLTTVVKELHKEYLENPETKKPLDLELLGATIGREAKVKRRKS
jgi:hypothetical protein